MGTRLFGCKEIDSLIKEKKSEIKSLIEAKEEDYIIGINEEEFIDYIYGGYCIEEISFDLDKVKVSSYESDTKYNRYTREKYIFQVVVYHVPILGNKGLIKYKPSGAYINHFPEVYLDPKEGNLCFEIELINIDANTVKSRACEILNTIKKQSFHLNNEIKNYNSTLKEYIRNVFISRKKRIFKNKKMLEELEIPVIEEKNISKSFIVPTPDIIKKIKIEEPKVIDKKYIPEPTISFEIYQHILETFHDLGKLFERYPSTYKEKNEESLRDQILLYISPRFELDTSSETFNKSGRTDILMKYKNSNIFVAECKIWKGEEKYLKGITQLLNYLTWRDSKTALVVFVKNKNFSNVLNKVKLITPKHENYLGFTSEKEESWINYRFHIIGDKGREVKIAVLLFHIPY